MRTNFDFSPCSGRASTSTMSWTLLENADRVAAIDNWPPYDIAKTSEDDYRIAMAVAGFTDDEPDIAHEPTARNGPERVESRAGSGPLDSAQRKQPCGAG